MNFFNCDFCNEIAIYFCFECKNLICSNHNLNKFHKDKTIEILTIQQQLFDKSKQVENIDYLENEIKEKLDIIINYFIEIKNNLLDRLYDDLEHLQNVYLKKIIIFNKELKEIDNFEKFKHFLKNKYINFDENNNLTFCDYEIYNHELHIIIRKNNDNFDLLNEIYTPEK